MTGRGKHPPRFPWPERGEISYNGIRQHFHEELDYVLELAREVARHEVILRVDESNARRKHVEKLRGAFVVEHQALIKKWSRP